MKQKQGKVQKEVVSRRQAEQMPKEKREMLEKILQEIRDKERAEEDAKEEADEEQVLDDMVDGLLQAWKREAKARKPLDGVGLAWLDDAWVEYVDLQNRDSKMLMLFDFKDEDEICSGRDDKFEGLALGESPTWFPTVVERDWHRFNRLRGCYEWYTPSPIWQEWVEMRRMEKEVEEKEEEEMRKTEEGLKRTGKKTRGKLVKREQEVKEEII